MRENQSERNLKEKCSNLARPIMAYRFVLLAQLLLEIMIYYRLNATGSAIASVSANATAIATVTATVCGAHRS